MIKPIYEKLATQHKDEIAFGLVDIDENSESGVDFEINAVPTFVFFDGEHAIDKLAGADVAQLNALVDKLQAK